MIRPRRGPVMIVDLAKNENIGQFVEWIGKDAHRFQHSVRIVPLGLARRRAVVVPVWQIGRLWQLARGFVFECARFAAQCLACSIDPDVASLELVALVKAQIVVECLF